MYSYTLKPEGVVISMLDRTTFQPQFVTMQASNPLFKKLCRALKRKEWKRVPKLISLAAHIADKSQGAVEVRKDGVYYKGSKIDNSLTQRILQIIKEGKPVGRMLKFMDNLMRNPAQFAIDELYDWLKGCNLPITDDGRFTAYRRVRADYKDCYTGTIDNSPGQIVFMKRSDVNPDRTQTCERGLHFCSAAYLPSYPGDRVMEVVVNPADVVSIPNDYNFTKGRTWRYEVVREVPAEQLEKLDTGTDIDDFQCSIFSIAKDTRKLRADVLALPTIKSMLRKQRQIAKRSKKVKRGRKAKNEMFLVSEQSIRKMTYGRLVALYKKFAPPEPPKVSVAAENRLRDIRKAYGLSRGEVAAHLGVSYGTVANYENAKALAQGTIDSYLDAIMALMNLGTTSRTGISFPKPTAKARAARATGSPTPVGAYTTADGGSFLDDEFGDEDFDRETEPVSGAEDWADEYGYEVDEDADI
jgi:transcriptional regulator with XRE-family HTH domain